MSAQETKNVVINAG